MRGRFVSVRWTGVLEHGLKRHSTHKEEMGKE